MALATGAGDARWDRSARSWLSGGCLAGLGGKHGCGGGKMRQLSTVLLAFPPLYELSRLFPQESGSFSTVLGLCRRAGGAGTRGSRNHRPPPTAETTAIQGPLFKGLDSRARVLGGWISIRSTISSGDRGLAMGSRRSIRAGPGTQPEALSEARFWSRSRLWSKSRPWSQPLHAGSEGWPRPRP